MNELIVTVLQKEWLLYAACCATGVGCLIQVALSVIYNRSLSASERMRGTKVPWLRQMKTRYESGYEWDNRIRNVELFVDKNIGRRKCMGIYLNTWEEIGGSMLWLEVLFSALGVIGSVTYINEITLATLHLMTGITLAVLFRGVTAFVNLKEKRNLLRTNLCDYFENTLQGEARKRYKDEKLTQERHSGYRNQREEIACTVAERSPEAGNDTGLAAVQNESGQQYAEAFEERKTKNAQSEKENRKAEKLENRQKKQAEKNMKKDVCRRAKQEKKIAKESVKLQRRQKKEQKRVEKLTRRMEKVQRRLGTAATLEGVQPAAGGKKEECARLKREQLKKKVDVTPAQEDQIIADVLREFLA